MKTARLFLFGAVIFFVLAAPRLVSARWSSYGPWFARVVGLAAQKMTPSQRIVVIGTTVFTPRAEVRVGSACDGFEGIRTFSILFGLILLLNYRHTGTFRLCFLYLFAILLLWIHNAARVAGAVILGGETHFATSEIMVLALAGGLALVAIREPPAGHLPRWFPDLSRPTATTH